MFGIVCFQLQVELLHPLHLGTVLRGIDMDAGDLLLKGLKDLQ